MGQKTSINESKNHSSVSPHELIHAYIRIKCIPKQPSIRIPEDILNICYKFYHSCSNLFMYETLSNPRSTKQPALYMLIPHKNNQLIKFTMDLNQMFVRDRCYYIQYYIKQNVWSTTFASHFNCLSMNFKRKCQEKNIHSPSALIRCGINSALNLYSIFPSIINCCAVIFDENEVNAKNEINNAFIYQLPDLPETQKVSNQNIANRIYIPYQFTSVWSDTKQCIFVRENMEGNIYKLCVNTSNKMKWEHYSSHSGGGRLICKLLIIDNESKLLYNSLNNITMFNIESQQYNSVLTETIYDLCYDEMDENVYCVVGSGWKTKILCYDLINNKKKILSESFHNGIEPTNIQKRKLWIHNGMLYVADYVPIDRGNGPENKTVIMYFDLRSNHGKWTNTQICSDDLLWKLMFL